MNNKGVIVVVSLLLLLLVGRCLWFYHSQENPANDTQVSFITTVNSPPTQQGKQQRFSVNYPNGPKIFIITANYPFYTEGENVTISGTIIGGSMRYPKITKHVETQPIGLALLVQLRQKTKHLFQISLSSNQAALLFGITFGGKEQMENGFLRLIQDNGLMHIIAASGMNVSMVTGFFLTVFSRFFRRQIAVTAALLGVVFYAIFAGLEPSIVRATIMSTFLLLGGLVGRQYTSIWALFLAAYSMLMIDPSLVGDIGFQLSFSATVGIMLAPFLRFSGGAEQALGPITLTDVKTTLAAQLATIPIMFGNFGNYNLMSVLVNALVLWMIPPLMVIGIVGSMVGLVVEPLGKLVLWLAMPLLMYFEAIVQFFDKYQLTFHSESWPLSLTVGYYCVLIAVYWSFHKENS